MKGGLVGNERPTGNKKKISLKRLEYIARPAPSLWPLRSLVVGQGTRSFAGRGPSPWTVMRPGRAGTLARRILKTKGIHSASRAARCGRCARWCEGRASGVLRSVGRRGRHWAFLWRLVRWRVAFLKQKGYITRPAPSLWPLRSLVVIAEIQRFAGRGPSMRR